MKIKHRVPAHLLPASDPVTPEYQAEVDRSTAKAEAAYRRAEQRLEREEARLERARGKAKTKRQLHDVKVLEALVELRRTELQKLHMMMVASPASSQHRGTHAGHRHIPSPGVF
jgi:hypothetical protein